MAHNSSSDESDDDDKPICKLFAASSSRKKKRQRISATPVPAARKKRQRINSPQKRVQSARKKKVKNRSKNLGKGRGGVATKLPSNVARWVFKIKHELKYKGAYTEHPIRAVVPADGTDKNYHCGCCGQYYKASCANDIKSHCDKRKHRKSFKEFIENGKRKQTSMNSITNRISEVKYDFIHQAYAINLSGAQAVSLVKGFLSKHPVRFSQQLPKNENSFSVSGDWMMARYKTQMQLEFKVHKSDEMYYHWCFLSDEGCSANFGLLVVLTSVDGITKPHLTRLDALTTSSNERAVTTAFIKNEREFDLDLEECVLSILDSVAYNKLSAEAVSLLCPYKINIFCPLHKFCNGQDATLNSTYLGGLILETFKESSKLFKNSKERKLSFISYLKTMETMHKDPLILDLIQNADPIEFCDIMGLERDLDLEQLQMKLSKKKTSEDKKPQSEDDDNDVNDNEEKSNANELSSSVLYLDRKNVISSSPPKYIHNKWKNGIFCAFWSVLNYTHLISWCTRYFRSESYFSVLPILKVRMVKVAVAFLFYLLHGYIRIILCVEKRKPIHHLLYDYITNYVDAIKSIPLDIVSINNKAFAKPDVAKFVYTTWEILPRKEKQKIIPHIVELRDVLHENFAKQFKDTDSSMKWWKACKNFDISHEDHPTTMLEAFGYLKGIVSRYKNQRDIYHLLEKEYLHLRTVMVPLFKEISVNDVVLDLGNMTQERMSLKLLVAKYKQDGDLINFYKQSPYKMLNVVAVKHLDNPNSNVDVERVMNYVKIISGDSQYNKSMKASNVMARLWGMWNEEICHNFQ